MNHKLTLVLMTFIMFGCGDEDLDLHAASATFALESENSTPAVQQQDPDHEEDESGPQGLGTDYFRCFVAGNCAPPALSSSLRCRAGRDYQIAVSDLKSEVVVLSFHGGMIEPHSSELAKAISERFHWSHYDFMAHGTEDCLGSRSNFTRLHITATNFDDPQAISLVSGHKKAIAIHGYSAKIGNSRGTICVGGANDAQVRQFIESVKLNRRRFTQYDLLPVNAAANPTESGANCRGLAGTRHSNLVNRASGGAGGIQLEMSRGIKEDLLNSNSRYDELRYVFYTALSSAMSR